MRVLEAGGRIVNDPGLVSRELAPDTVGALWNQRMRWAQGWFQVSLRHLWPIVRSPGLSLRQRIGVVLPARLARGLPVDRADSRGR